MVDTRPKRTAAAKAESENKRIALAAMKPMEAQDLQTQDVVERDRPAPHKRSSVQPEAETDASPKKISNRSSIADVPAVGMGMTRSVQVQVVIPQRSSTYRSGSVPTLSRSQSVPPAGSFKHPSPPQPNIAPSRPPEQNLPVSGTFQRPPSHARAPGPNPQAQTNNAPRNLQQPTRLANAPEPNPSHSNPQVQRQCQHSAGPGPVPVVPKPSLIEQVKSANRGARQQQQLQQPLSESATNPPALVHTQATNSIAIGFHEAGPVHRAMTKIAEGKMTSQAPPIDALAAQRLGREVSPEEMSRLIALARLGTGQHLQKGLQAPLMGGFQPVSGQQPQQGYQVQRMGAPQPVPVQQLQQGFQLQHPIIPQSISGQQPQHSLQVQRAGIPQQGSRQQSAPNQAPRPRHHSFPPGRPVGLPSASPLNSNKQSREPNGQAPIDTDLPRASSEAPGGSVLPINGTRINPANSAVLTPHPNQPRGAANGQATIPTGHLSASSEAPVRYMQPLVRRRSHSANAAAPSSQNPDVSDSRLPTLSPNEPKRAVSMGGKPHFDYPRPPELSLTNKSAVIPRIKIKFNANATPGIEQPEDSDTTLSPSPLKATRQNFDSDATLSPSPLKASRPKLGHVIPPAPLFNKANTPPTEENPFRNKPISPKKALSSQEPLIRQQNLDFDYKPVPQQDETPVGFDREVVEANGRAIVAYNTPVALPGTKLSQASFCNPQEEGEETDQPRPNVFSQRQSHSLFCDDLAARIQLRSDALERRQDRTCEDDEELRLSTTLTKTLTTLKLGRALDKSKVTQENSPLGLHSSKVIPGCLAVTQLPAAIEMSFRTPPQTFHELMTDDDDDVCVFCNYESSFGIADSRVWLPVEASPGFCNECHEDTQEVFKMWESSHRLTHGLTEEKKEKYRALLGNSTTTPLKELGNTTDFKAQQKVEMSKPRRQNAILNASRPCMRDGRKDRREQRKEYNLATSVRNLPRGGKLPARRAISGDVTRRNTLAADVQRAVSEDLRKSHQQMSSALRIKNMPPTPSPLSIPAPTFLNPNSSQAAHTGWVNGAPSALPTMGGSIAPGHPTSRVITPNSAAFMGLLDLSAPPGSAISSTATSPGTGTPNSTGTAVPSPTLSNSSIPGYPNTAPRPTSTSAQPTGPSGIPRYFNSGPPGSFLSPPPFNNGPTFCRGCPWRLIDFTKAKICATCRDCKFLICTHSNHTGFQVLATVHGVVNGEHKGHGLGKVTRDGSFITDGRYTNCMICTGQATHGCNDCPLRLCGECVVRLTKMCKGKVSELLNFYNQGRDHIRNDAFLLRNDNKGF
ncbi:hypothetical protein IFR05_001292 [Cadophora sp. M221]|nr:hypothetical protein IFR05_001292 [Cadophora sp. M221]